MRFLADESCDFAVVRSLRASGHDVVAVSEIDPGAADIDVIHRARAEERILLTEDKDFGQLVFAGGKGGVGVVLLRFPARARRQSSAAVLDLVARFPARLPVSFVVLEPRRVRISTRSSPWQPR